MPLPDLPTMGDYIARHESYQQYIGIIFLLAALLAVALARWGRGRGVRLRLKLPHIIAVGAVLRLPLLRQDYWYDEAFTSALVGRPWGDMLTAVLGDVHPPFYYALVKVFSDTFGHGDIVMRLPAYLSSLGLIIAMHEIGRAHGGARVGRWAALLTALLPALAYYGAEARYPAFMALMLATSYIGIQKRHMGLVSSSLALVSVSHVNGWFYVVLVGGYALHQRRGLRSMFFPGLAIGLWFPVAAVQSADVANGFWLQQSIPLRHIVDMTITTRFSSIPAGLALVPTVGTIALISVAVWGWRRRSSALWLVLVVGAPVLQWLVGVAWHPIYLERTLLFSALLLLVPLAWWLDTRAPGWAVLLLVGLLGVGLVSLYHQDRSGFDNALAHCGPHQTIYATNTKTAILAAHAGRDVIAYRYGNSTSQALPLSARKALFAGVAEDVPSGSCVVAYLDNFATDRELAHLAEITAGRFHVVEVGGLAVYVVANKVNFANY